MDERVQDFNLLKPLYTDGQKTSYLAEHKTLKSPYIVQVAPDTGEVKAPVKPLKGKGEIGSLEEYIQKHKDLPEESVLFKLLSQMIEVLDAHYAKSPNTIFGLSSKGVFITDAHEVHLIETGQLDTAMPLSQGEGQDLVTFGQIAYFLMTHEWPLGYFPLPSEVHVKLDKKWDELIKGCLHHKPSMRFANFSLLKTKLEHLESENSLKPLLKPQELVRPEFEPNPGHVFQQELTVGKYAPAPKENLLFEPIMTPMVVIRGGDYARGSNSGARDEMPRHMIQLGAFALDIHPVTNEQFVRFLEAMGGEKDAQNNDMIRLKDSRIKKAAGKLMIESGYSKHPVVGVSWYGAHAYAKWVGKRLPTEAEWEVAASSGKEMLYPTGSNLEKGMANFFSSDTTPVMSFAPTELGLYDMAGNVYEWCSDWYGYNYYEASIQEPLDPQGPQQGVYRVLRGGCWKSLKDDLRVSHRHRNNPGAVTGAYGFRCASDVE